MLSLESDIADARLKIHSLLSDFGVEAGLWNLPNISEADVNAERERCFPNCMPMNDIDHMLHHVVSDGEEAFGRDNALWTDFRTQVEALAKCFSKRDHVERFTQKSIMENPSIPLQHKKALMGMFQTMCPTYCPTRWHFFFDVLHWLSKREQIFDYLQGIGRDDMTRSEIESMELLGRRSSKNFGPRFGAIMFCRHGDLVCRFLCTSALVQNIKAKT